MNMRWSISTFILGLVLCAFPVSALPRINAPVNDYAGVLQPYEVERIANRIRNHQARTSNQIALLVVHNLEGLPIEDYSIRVARDWGGGQAGVNNGILVIFALDEHRSRIEVGPGLQGQVPDSVASALLVSIRPQLRAAQYGDAFYSTVDTLVMRTGGVPDTAFHRQAQPPPSQGISDDDIFVIILAIVVLAILLTILLSASNRRGGGSSSTFFWFDGGGSSGSSGGGWGGDSNSGGYDGGGGGFDGGGGSGSW